MEEVFEKLSAHFIKGMMIHDQMARYYDFLGLRGYKRCHEYQFYSDSINFRRINRYYINHHSKLIPEMRIDDPEIIPDSWYAYTREDVNTQTKRNAVETGMNEWVKWERETKAALEDAIKELYTNGYVDDSMYLKCFLKRVSHELKLAERKVLDLKAVNYDIGYIIGEQTHIHDKYLKKMKGMIE